MAQYLICFFAIVPPFPNPPPLRMSQQELLLLYIERDFSLETFCFTNTKAFSFSGHVVLSDEYVSVVASRTPHTDHKLPWSFGKIRQAGNVAVKFEFQIHKYVKIAPSIPVQVCERAANPMGV